MLVLLVELKGFTRLPDMSTPHTDAFSSSPSQDREPAQPATFKFLVRTARQQDLQGLADVLTASFHSQDGVQGWIYPLLRLGIYEDLRGRMRSQSAHQACLVAVSRMPGTVHHLAGTVEISLRTPQFWNDYESRYLYLSNLAVQADFRRRGVARQLLLHCERIALDWGFHDLYLHVLEDNHQARGLYTKAGYRLHRTETGMSNWLFGKPRQLLLHKALAPAEPL